MSPSELAILFESQPDRPLRLTLASGDVVTLRTTRDVVIDGLSLVIFRIRDEAKRLGKWKFISIPNIVLAESLDGPLPPSDDERRPRRKR